jgi:glycosyltransferase involved in cell wall biosynthesis
VESDRRQLERLYQDSTFFLLPTRAECAGIVFCEANAFGLPVISTDTGGVSEIVHSGSNGYLLPLPARGAEYATKIIGLIENPDAYRALRRSSRDEFERRLNWDTWGIGMHQIFSEVLHGKADIKSDSPAMSGR